MTPEVRKHKATYVIPCGYCRVEFEIAAWGRRRGRKFCFRGCSKQATRARSREKSA